MRTWAVWTVCAACFVALLVQGMPAWPQEAGCALAVYNRQGKSIPVKVEKADSEFRRRKGLMFRKSMAPDHGMLFIFESEQRLAFWMRNTYIPLSIAYIDARGIIREIYEMRALDDSATYPSKGMVKYALEMNKGWFAAHDVIPGCRIILDGCLGK